MNKADGDTPQKTYSSTTQLALCMCMHNTNGICEVAQEHLLYNMIGIYGYKAF